MSRSSGGRRPSDPLKAAEAAFRTATTKPIEEPQKTPSLPGVKETVTLRTSQDVLEFFQKDSPGWQNRINSALRKANGK
ncbi:BrnA antitoxin family protein [Microvirga zambiensis]|uniref:BrnA antitoxin family protein n=1 Tax=Microvirga zambiensis TaxID=1402137 RepID=UPI00191CED21|nr:BrnA antitoxin family protein [Microvirga zambiensis]